jgi:hypothetical protein
METEVAGGAIAPASITCSRQEAIRPANETCEYAVLNASQPMRISAAEDAAGALGKALLTFDSAQQYEAVRASLADSHAAALLAQGALRGLWVDMAGSAYLPAGYTPPVAGQASLLAGASLTPTNVPVATTVAAALVTKCTEVDTTIGELAAGPAMSPPDASP